MQKLSDLFFFIDLYLIILFLFIIVLSIFIYFINNIILNIICILFIFIFTAMIFLLLEADFLAFMILIIYGGAIVILFIFVLMLISLKRKKETAELINILSFIFNIFIFYIIIYKYFYSDINFFQIYINNFHFKNYPKYLLDLELFKLLINFKNYHQLYNSIELSNLSIYSIILYNEQFFETLYIGLILILALVYIIFLFKK
jgi:NADH:ubiquinone oxidoreductase subunit 6 (subunit J)